MEAAVRHAFAAGDLDRAADLIEVATPELRRQRAEGVLRSWVPLVPAEVLARRPVLASNLVGALMASNAFDGVSERLDALERSLSSPPESLTIRNEAEWARLPAQVATHRAGLALVAGDVAATLAHADDALARAAADDQLTVASASALKGLASWANGDLLAALRGVPGSHPGTCRDGARLGRPGLHRDRGRPRAAARPPRRRPGTQPSVLSNWLRPPPETWRVEVPRWCEGRPTCGRRWLAWPGSGATTEEAAQHLGRAGDLGEAAGLPQQPYRWRVAMAHLRESEGDTAAADALLSEAERLFNSDFSPNVRPVPAVRARLHIRGRRPRSSPHAGRPPQASLPTTSWTTCASTST